MTTAPQPAAGGEPAPAPDALTEIIQAGDMPDGMNGLAGKDRAGRLRIMIRSSLTPAEKRAEIRKLLRQVRVIVILALIPGAVALALIHRFGARAGAAIAIAAACVFGNCPHPAPRPEHATVRYCEHHDWLPAACHRIPHKTQGGPHP
jgi:hypothetical protein